MTALFPAAEHLARPAAMLAAIVLAGDRPGGNALARAHGVPASVLVPVAGRRCIDRVVTTLRASARVAGGLVVGPPAAVMATDRAMQELLAPGDFAWLEPAHGPSASALRAVTTLARYPVLLTAGDHALLEPAVVDRFCLQAGASTCDFVVGLVPHSLVAARFPASKRTILRLRDGAWCGSNLFLVRTPAGARALEFWQTLEVERKRPWRMARRLGVGFLAAYLTGTLTLDTALARLSALSGCAIGVVEVASARTAVDVDSAADLALAEEVLRVG